MAGLFDSGIFDPGAISPLVVKTRVADLITATMKLIGALSPAQVPSSNEMADVFLRLQSMLGSWTLERLWIFQVVPTTFALVAGKQTYSIGPGGDFNVPRPVWIEDAGVVSNTNPLQPLELPVRILDDNEWASLSIKNVASSLSWYLWYDHQFNGNYGTGNIKLWPIPTDSTVQLALYLPTAIPAFAAPTDVMVLPPGTEEAIRFNLAVRLCPEFGRPLDPVVAKLAVDSFALVQRSNSREHLLSVDEALMSNGQGIFSWLTGSTGSRGR